MHPSKKQDAVALLLAANLRARYGRTLGGLRTRHFSGDCLKHRLASLRLGWRSLRGVFLEAVEKQLIVAFG